MAFYDSIKLEKGMYANGKSLTETLEELDPSANYKNTDMEGLDSFQRQLKRYDIKVCGSHSDDVQKFFQTANSAVLFPEYISRAVMQGMKSADVLSDITAAKTVINGLDYRSVTSSPVGENNSIVAEGAELPQTEIKTNPNLVSLTKRGRVLTASYEALKYQRLDIFTVTLRQIGAYIAREQLSDAVNVLVNGDGGNNAAETITESGTFSYNSLLKLWAGLDFHGTGKMLTPLGAKLICAPTLASNKIIGLDKNCALEMIQSGGIVIDSDKLIDRQLGCTAISCTTGFSKIFTDAAKVLSI